MHSLNPSRQDHTAYKDRTLLTPFRLLAAMETIHSGVNLGDLPADALEGILGNLDVLERCIIGGCSALGLADLHKCFLRSAAD